MAPPQVTSGKFNTPQGSPGLTVEGWVLAAADAGGTVLSVGGPDVLPGAGGPSPNCSSPSDTNFLSKCRLALLCAPPPPLLHPPQPVPPESHWGW